MNPESSTPGFSESGAVWVFYHYLYPDQVVSAVLMDDLCRGFQQQGWTVTGFSANRSSDESQPAYAGSGEHEGVHVRRIWRPPVRQSTSLGRLLNAGWMIAAWSLLALSAEPPAAVVLGTDPVLSVVAAIFWKFFAPETRILHWCFDLYPEAAYADGLLPPTGWLARLLSRVMHLAYRCCDAIVDIGPCMRERLAIYQSSAVTETIVPWALEEPATVLPPPREERQLIAPGARLALLYAGSFGRAHIFEDLLLLAEALRGENAAVAFSVRGNREQALHAAVDGLAAGSTCPVRFVPFAPADRLLARLAAPDVHLLSLAHHWQGLVVPSKFFGALAVGRPVLFSGSADSSIAQWILHYKLGWVLDPANVTAVAADLVQYVSEPQRMNNMQQRCLDTYRAHFSKASGIGRMQSLLSRLLHGQDV